MDTRTYVVSGMTCGHCVTAVESEVASVAGVTGVTADLATKLVRVSGEGLDDDALREAIAEAGYEAE